MPRKRPIEGILVEFCQTAPLSKLHDMIRLMQDLYKRRVKEEQAAANEPLPQTLYKLQEK